MGSGMEFERDNSNYEAGMKAGAKQELERIIFVLERDFDYYEKQIAYAESDALNCEYLKGERDKCDGLVLFLKERFAELSR